MVKKDNYIELVLLEDFRKYKARATHSDYIVERSMELGSENEKLLDRIASWYNYDSLSGSNVLRALDRMVDDLEDKGNPSWKKTQDLSLLDANEGTFRGIYKAEYETEQIAKLRGTDILIGLEGYYERELIVARERREISLLRPNRVRNSKFLSFYTGTWLKLHIFPSKREGFDILMDVLRAVRPRSMGNNKYDWGTNFGVGNAENSNAVYITTKDAENTPSYDDDIDFRDLKEYKRINEMIVRSTYKKFDYFEKLLKRFEEKILSGDTRYGPKPPPLRR